MNTLQNITGYESGVIVYHSGGQHPEALCLNWSSIDGVPRTFAGLIIGMGEALDTLASPLGLGDVPNEVLELAIVTAEAEERLNGGDASDLILDGAWSLGNGITVFTFIGWN
jgi:hypothetical protein